MKILPPIFILTLLIWTACIARPTVKVSDEDEHARQSAYIRTQVEKIAESGDWLVIRGYHATDDLVSNATAVPISHAGIYDAETQTVIEAEGRGVLETPIDAFIHKSYRLLIIRPRWRTETNAETAVSNARDLVGMPYDFSGTLGLNSPNRYYCTELAVTVYKQWHSPIEKFPSVIRPGELYLYGRILFDSMPRDEIGFTGSQ